MSGKHPVQANGRGTRGTGKRPSSGRANPGDSGGGAYRDTHRGDEPQDGFLGHGGQSDLDEKLNPGQPDD